MNISNEERDKAQSVALEILKQFQDHGLTEKEVQLAIFWMGEIAKNNNEKKHLKMSFSLEEI